MDRLALILLAVYHRGSISWQRESTQKHARHRGSGAEPYAVDGRQVVPCITLDRLNEGVELINASSPGRDRLDPAYAVTSRTPRYLVQGNPASASLQNCPFIIGG